MIAWDGAGWGVFSLIGYDLYFARVDPNGAVTVPLTRLTAAYSQTFGGQFQVRARGGAYFVLYSDTNPTTTRLMKVSLGGTVVEAVPFSPGWRSASRRCSSAAGSFFLCSPTTPAAGSW
ncbi:MAG: hypothetical protein ACOX6T_07565 [Myxococcales bacterium]|jgi:hypothetical protein